MKLIKIGTNNTNNIRSQILEFLSEGKHNLCPLLNIFAFVGVVFSN